MTDFARKSAEMPRFVFRNLAGARTGDAPVDANLAEFYLWMCQAKPDCPKESQEEVSYECEEFVHAIAVEALDSRFIHVLLPVANARTGRFTELAGVGGTAQDSNR